MTLRRGKSDILSNADVARLEIELRAYVADCQERGERLWDFGIYGAALLDGKNLTGDGKQFSEKSAPDIAALVVCYRLWLVFLKFMPHAKMKDSYVVQAVSSILKSCRAFNNTKMPDKLFLTWFAKQCTWHLHTSGVWPNIMSATSTGLPGLNPGSQQN